VNGNGLVYVTSITEGEDSRGSKAHVFVVFDAGEAELVGGHV
jgi:hypothetical protein